MSRFLKQGKTVFGSPAIFKETLHTTNHDGEMRYNKDLLPSPPGTPQRYSERELILTYRSGQKMEMATLFRVLSDDDVFSKLI
jgi:hypothetical protein